MTKRCESSPPTHAGNPIDGTTRATARRAAQDAPLWGARRKPHPKGADTLLTRELSHSLCHERAVLPCWRFRTTRRGGSNSIHRREEHEAPVVFETVPPSIHIELRIVSEGEIELGGGGDPLQKVGDDSCHLSDFGEHETLRD